MQKINGLALINFKNHKLFNPLSPHDALMHHVTSLKTDMIFLQPRVFNENSHETGLAIYGDFL